MNCRLLWRALPYLLILIRLGTLIGRMILWHEAHLNLQWVGRPSKYTRLLTLSTGSPNMHHFGLREISWPLLHAASSKMHSLLQSTLTLPHEINFAIS